MRGGGGPGSVSNLLMALFLKRAGLEMNAVSYRGTAPALTDIIGGHVPAMFIPLPEAMPQAGDRRGAHARAVRRPRARTQAKDVPTIAESGFPGFRGVSWNGMMAPAGTPKGDHRPRRRRVHQAPRRIRSSSRSSTSTAPRRSGSRPRNSPNSSRRTSRCGPKR